MNAGRRVKFALMALCAVALVLAIGSPAFSQCAMCKTALTGSPEARKLAESLNFAIIVLLIPPVLMFCGFFFALFRHLKKSGTAGLSPETPRGSAWQNLAQKVHLPGRGKKAKRRTTGGAHA
ncbi:MAG TPA: hypothetical protein VJT09_15245 [Pyrinomonadaceae bacterium]|nr:hypothetical protein [Pyrinomonadaceae bacterium]